jgi:orotate phosphoribosyltransferase
MILNDESALKVAEFLLQIKAIKLQPNKPFTWASGWRSPIYCDNRVTLSYPKVRTYIRQQFVNAINEKYAKPDVIAGVATGGIAQGALVAQELGLPFVYIRSETKKHGLTNMIEGVVEKGQSVVVIEDLISTGGSSLKAVEALREAGCEVKGMAAIFTYGFKTAEDNFKEAKCKLITLSNYETLVKQALQSKYITEKDLKSLQEWRLNPADWGKVTGNQ